MEYMALRWPYILEQTKKMPLRPGVYIFEDKNKKPLYIGRATCLRKRVLSYFRLGSDLGRDRRLEEMLGLAKRIKYFKTANLLEAVILEANLIKKHWPKYNVKEKDDRSFVYILISKKDDFSSPILVRKHEIENWKLKIENFFLFGPYQSLSLITSALRIIRKIFPYSTCKVGSGKPCFDYQIRLCPGACVNAISKEDYQNNIDNIILLLKGENKKLFRKLKNENPEKVIVLKHIQDAALIKNENFQFSMTNFQKINRIEGYDISHLTGKETFGSMAVFTGGKPDKTQYRLFKIKDAPANDDLRALEEMITRRFAHSEWRFPDLILIDGGLPQIRYISKTLEKINISIPFVGISKYMGAASPKAGEPRPDKSGRDKLVFPAKMKSSLKDLISAGKQVLLKVREEAHRFAIKSSRRSRKRRAPSF